MVSVPFNVHTELLILAIGEAANLTSSYRLLNRQRDLQADLCSLGKRWFVPPLPFLVVSSTRPIGTHPGRDATPGIAGN